MSYCLNPVCSQPQNPDVTFCQSCGAKLLLRERYRAVRQIGQGGFGKTFLAVDQDLPNKPACVIKQFSPQIQGASGLQKATELFEQEAVQLNILGKHPQIPELLAHFEQDGRLYLVQEYVKGRNLAEELAQDGAFSEAKIRELLVGLLPVLQYIHDNQVIHRDIKPENIIRRDDGKLFLVDFGAAKLFTGTLIITGTRIGTAEYAAPEQTRGKAEPSSDLYSFGVSCIHLLTNTSPFDLLDRSNRWVWEQYLTTSLDSSLRVVLNKLIESAIDSRYQSVSDVLQVLSNKNLMVISNQVNPVIKQENLTISEIVSQSLIKPVKINRKWSYQDQSGQIITEFLFDTALPFSEGLAAVKFEGKWGFIDQLGRFVIAPKLTYYRVGSFNNGLAKFCHYSSNTSKYKYGLIDKSGHVIVEPQFDKIDKFFDGLAQVSTQKWDRNGFIYVSYGLVNNKGDLIVEPSYVDISGFINGLAMVKSREGYHGFIDKKGNFIAKELVNQQRQVIFNNNFVGFSEGLAAFELNKKWGFINGYGKVVIEPNFLEVQPFLDGLAKVRAKVFLRGDKWRIIDKTGKFVD